MAEIFDVHRKKLDVKDSFVKTRLANVNDHYFGIAWMEGTYRYHKHNADEMFLVLEGHLKIEVAGTVHELDPGMGIVIKAGEVHRSSASPRTLVAVFEPQNIDIEYAD